MSFVTKMRRSGIEYSRRLTKGSVPSTTLALRGALFNTPPPLFDGEISCPAWIIGQFHGSGHVPGLDVMAKRREFWTDPRTILGRDTGVIPDRRSGHVLGEFRLFY